ncbi:Acyltransferase family protein [Acetatifactor muris]|uniref:Acyltransferase family protein n=2 Tax=Acetatifactor muris TaxID=879566 RepID=A0A2K4ZGA0_9FIRM|nr:Acyltransferase family protein [Acetatifactor muris]
MQEKRYTMHSDKKQGRMANLEMLRCVAMMMVVVLHYLGKGELLSDLAGDRLGAGAVAAWLLEAFCIVAVNVYMLISGYFLCCSSFKVSRLIRLWLQVWVYSVGVGLLGALSGVLTGVDFDAHYLLTLVFPISMGHYWFMTAYVFLYLLLPFVAAAAGRMTRQQLQAALSLLLFTFCILKSVLPLRLETDGMGYDCLWYLCVFLTAAYIRRFGIPFLEKSKNCLFLYVGGCLLIFGGTFLLRAVYLRTGSLGRMLKMCLEYNHILPFLAAVGLFGAFARMKLKGRCAELFCRIGPCTLGVYLLHENLGFRYAWQSWFGAGKAAAAMAEGGPGAVGTLLLWTAAAVLGIFVCGIFVDMLRKGIFDLLHRGLLKFRAYGGLLKRLERVDGLFVPEKEARE